MSASWRSPPEVRWSIREAAKLIAYIPQSSHPAFNYSVRDIVLMGTTSGLGTFSTPKKEDLRRVDEALEKIGIPHLAERCFHRISGGERQAQDQQQCKDFSLHLGFLPIYK